MIIKYEVKKEDDNFTVKYILKNKLYLSTNNIKSLKFLRKIFLNNIPVRVREKISENDIVSVDFNINEEVENVLPEKMDLCVLYEDEGIIAVDKPAGIVVHPLAKYPTGTLANGLRHYFDNKGLRIKIRPISRLDRDTSGIILFAKNPYIQHYLVLQMKDRMFIKEYVAVLEGNLIEKQGTIQKPIGRLKTSIITRIIDPKGLPSVTHYEVLESYEKYDLVKFVLETGRTHQIRVHTQSIGHPIVGDTLYNSNVYKNLNGQLLHSNKVSFKNPVSNNITTITSDIPKYMKTFISNLKKT